METTIVYWDYIGIMETNMETNYHLEFRVWGGSNFRKTAPSTQGTPQTLNPAGGLHSWKLTWKPKRNPIKTTVPLKWGYVGFHVSSISFGDTMAPNIE